MIKIRRRFRRVGLGYTDVGDIGLISAVLGPKRLDGNTRYHVIINGRSRIIIYEDEMKIV